ncbi:MAG: GNAT family N-acetyltransferase [Bacteroidales bacterium]|mgnify:FL=1|nr:GNAT family N-acetyltransferase [Bacteroidales bacterium]
MELKVIKHSNSVQWNKVWNLYKESFPLAERRKLEDHLRACKNEFFHPLSAWEGNQFIGIVFYWEWKNYRYVEYLAVDPELHGHGYGSQIIKQIKDSQHTIILEIDPLINELSVRRLQFYEQAGFSLTPYRFVHLPYRLDSETQELLILSYPQMITKEQHKEFLNFIENNIRNYCEVPS